MISAADFEEATGGKWRAGDPAKSGRAFLRAIEIYNNGLARHPRDFDLAYNKARLELDLSQQPSLVAKLPVSLVELLQQAQKSHRYALGLNQENSDILFNTAQVQISLAEEISEDATYGTQDDSEQLLREALDLLNACFSRQERLMEEQKAPPFDDGDENAQGGVSLNEGGFNHSETSSEVEQSATIQHPVTVSDMLDTACASLSALTLLISLGNLPDLSKLSTMADSLITNTIPQCMSQLPEDQRSEAAAEVALQSAELTAAVSNAEFMANGISLSVYASRVGIFETLNLQSDLAAICTYADTLIELATAMVQKQTSEGSALHSLSGAGSVPSDSIGSAAWQASSRAQSLYGIASKLQNNPDLTAHRKAMIYESRGDVEMLRFRLTAPEWQLSTSLQEKAKDLVNNASIYYRGAAQQYQNSGDDRAALKARVRETVAKTSASRLLDTSDETRSEYMAQLGIHGGVSELVVKDMIAENLIVDLG